MRAADKIQQDCMKKNVILLILITVCMYKEFLQWSKYLYDKLFKTI